MKSTGREGLTGQMVSFGVPSSCTIRSTCCISELPGSRGLWASNSAKMQPTALQGRRNVSGETSTQPPGHTLLCSFRLQPCRRDFAHLPTPNWRAPSGRRGWRPFFLTTYRWPWSAWLCPRGARGPGTCKGKESVTALGVAQRPARLYRRGQQCSMEGGVFSQLTTVSPLLESSDSGGPCRHEPAQSPLQEKTAQRGQGACCSISAAPELSTWHLRCYRQRLTCLHATFVSHEQVGYLEVPVS